MADEQDGPEADVTPDRDPARSPRPGAGAASRARRIGGRPPRAVGAPGATPTEPAETEASDTEPSATDASDAKISTVKSSAATTSAAGAPDAHKSDSDSDSDESAARPRPRRTSEPVELPGWLRWAPAAILTAGVIAMAIVLFVASDGVWRGKPSVASERDKVLAAAKNCVAVVSTYKYTDLAAYRSKGLACAMGQFRSDFAKAVDEVIKPKAPQLKAVQTAQINKGGLQSVVDGQWTVVVYGQVNVINTSTPKGRLDPLGAVVRMEQSHGTWLIAKLDLINGNGIS